MNIKKPQKKSMKECNNVIESICEKIKDADRIVIGVGAGLSASAGLDYNDKEFFAKMYKPFLKKGYSTISEGVGKNWYLTRENATKYWGFWANHINNVFYSQQQLDTYKLLYDIIKDRKYFVITTNADGQFFKGGFDPNKVFAMQGSYGKFQCQHGCNDVIYDNEEIVGKMLRGFNEESLEIRENDIPICPECGKLLCPNLRIDQYFVEVNHMHNKKDYAEFISASDEKILFLELGVGFNTPVIIRYPFEEMTMIYDNATLIRVNKMLLQAPEAIKSRAIMADMDIHKLLESMKKSSEG